MRSPRTDALFEPVRRVVALPQRLNARLVLALATVVGVALLVSGIALAQILPGYFVDQAERRAETAARATSLLVRTNADFLRQQRPAWLLTPELRNTRLLRPVAENAATELAQGTVVITYGDGTIGALAEPDPAADAALREQGLLPDPEVAPQSYPDVLRVSAGSSVQLIYTSRTV